MKYVTIIILCWFYNNLLNAQIENPWFFEDYHSQPESEKKSSGSKYAPNGIAFTPKGEMRILIVCAGFGEPYDSYDVAFWPNGANTLPDWVNDKSTFYNQNSDFANYAHLNNKQNVSRFFNEMSMDSFKLIADIYPTRINVDATGSYNWAGLTRKVFEKMKLNDPDFDWSVYDNRDNEPNFTFDNRNSQPDNVPDYIVLLFRYNRGWANQPVNGMQNWTGSGGGYAALNGLSGFSYNGNTFSYKSGYTHCLATANMFGLFIHEIAHSIFDCPHYAHANSVVGQYFYGQNGWGMMNLGSGAFSSALGWERWYLNWIELESNGVNSDIANETDLPLNGEFILRDFITTGDVVRIKVPNGSGKNQYVWLENHQGISIFDNRGWVNDGCGDPFPPSPRGMVAYIESIHDDLDNPFSFWTENHYTANGIKYLHAKGNFDYTYSSYSSPCNLWQNLIYNLTEQQENPISGQNRAEMLRFDFNNDYTIFVNTQFNGVNPKNEEHWVAERDSIITTDLMGHEIVFEVGQKLGMASNPPLINRPLYSTSSVELTPFFLNGISVELLEIYPNGNIRIKVAFNDINIDKDIRWSGNIQLPDITGDFSPDLRLQNGRKLTLNQSQTTNRHTLLNGEFFNPTKFHCLGNSLLQLNNNSVLVVEDKSVISLEAGSILELDSGSILFINEGSTLQLKNGSSLHISGTGRVEIKDGGYICIENGAAITLQDTLSVINLRPGSIAGVNTNTIPDPGTCLSNPENAGFTGDGSINQYIGDIYVQNEIFITDEYITGSNIFVGREVTGSPPFGDVTIENGAHVIFDAAQTIIFESGFEVKVGGILTAGIR